MSQKIIKAPTDHKVQSVKSYQNGMLDDLQKRKIIRGETEFIKVSANSSIMVLLPYEVGGFISYNLMAKDQIGGLSYYICDVTDKSFSVLVENLTTNEREIKIAFKIELN